jgi:hypothetical protein
VKDTTPIRDLFVSDVTRDIPPVVYFHEQSPAKLAAEVGEYIITGGWPRTIPIIGASRTASTSNTSASSTPCSRAG